MSDDYQDTAAANPTPREKLRMSVEPDFVAMWADGPKLAEARWKAWQETQNPNVHKDGVPWHQAPVPRRRHDCWTQTRGTLGFGTDVHRCPCGAVRMDRGRDDRGVWIERNARLNAGEDSVDDERQRFRQLARRLFRWA